MTSDEKVAAAFAKAREAHGQERVLVNCAGVANAAKTVGRDKETKAAEALSDEPVRAGHPDQPDRLVPLHRHRRSAWSTSIRWRTASAAASSTPLGRGRGRPDRPGGLFGVQGRRAGDGAADRARPDERRRPGQHHPAGRFQDADGRDDAAATCRKRWARRCRSRSGSARPRNMRELACFIVETRTSTPNRSASTAASGWRRAKHMDDGSCSKTLRSRRGRPAKRSWRSFAAGLRSRPSTIRRRSPKRTGPRS